MTNTRPIDIIMKSDPVYNLLYNDMLLDLEEIMGKVLDTKEILLGKHDSILEQKTRFLNALIYSHMVACGYTIETPGSAPLREGITFAPVIYERLWYIANIKDYKKGFEILQFVKSIPTGAKDGRNFLLGR